MANDGNTDLVAEWQDVMTLWEDLQADLVEAEAHLNDPGLGAADRERYKAIALDVSAQLNLAKQRIDTIVREARHGRVGRTGDFVVAELGPDLVSDGAQAPSRPGVAASRR